MGNKNYKIIPFLITTGTLIFFVFWIGGLGYKYHLETEERRITLNKDISEEAKKLNNALHEENIKLKQENENLKSAPYKLIRDTGEIEYYNLFTHKLVKKIDLDDNIYEYNNDVLFKKTDKYRNIYEYGTHGKLIKKTLPDGVWMEYNPVNEKLMKRKNINCSIEEFDANEEKFKEIDKEGKVKYFKTKLYQTVEDFKKLFINDKGLEKAFLESRIFNLEDLKAAGYTSQQLKAAGYTSQQLKDVGFKNIKNIEEIHYQSDGKTIQYIQTLDFLTKQKIQQTWYRPDGKTIHYINEYDPETGKLIKEEAYKDDGKTIDYITKFNSYKNPTITTYYNPDGKITSIEEFNSNKPEVIKETFYNLDGTVKEIKTY